MTSDALRQRENTTSSTVDPRRELIDDLHSIPLDVVRLNQIRVVMLVVDSADEIDVLADDAAPGLAYVDDAVAHTPRLRRGVVHVDGRDRHREPVAVLRVTPDHQETVGRRRHAVVAART